MAGTFSWWNWRPGMSPIRALLAGLPLLLLSCAFLATGLSILISGITLPASTHHSGTAGILAILLGLLLLPFALYLTFGGWHDLRQQKQTITGKVIALRTTATNILRQGRVARPGMTARLGQAWYGMALQPLEPLELPGLPEQPEQAIRQPVVVFRLTEDQYRDMREGMCVQVTYTRHLHHTASLRQVEDAK